MISYIIKIIYSEIHLVRNDLLKLILLTISIFPFSVYADPIAEWGTATTKLTESIRTISPQFVLLGIVVAAVSAILWICAPVTKKFTAWSWGVLGTIAIFYILTTYYSAPIKSSFSFILDPFKDIIPS
jgi:hypothetical protein